MPKTQLKRGAAVRSNRIVGRLTARVIAAARRSAYEITKAHDGDESNIADENDLVEAVEALSHCTQDEWDDAVKKWRDDKHLRVGRFGSGLEAQNDNLTDVVTEQDKGRCAPAPCSATYNFKNHPQTPEELRAKAEALWQLLDDISTAFDMYKPTMAGFERRVWHLCEQRSNQFQSDGHKLYATQSPNDKLSHGAVE